MIIEPERTFLPSSGDPEFDQKATRYYALGSMVVNASFLENVLRDLLMAAVSPDPFRGYCLVAEQQFSWTKQQLEHFAQQFIKDEELLSEILGVLKTCGEMWARRNVAVHGLLDDGSGAVEMKRPRKGQLRVVAKEFHTGELQDLSAAFWNAAHHLLSIRGELKDAGMLKARLVKTAMR